MTWVQAEKNCISMGGNLASVHNTDEYYGIQSVIHRITNAYPDTWIGGYDAIQEGEWLWSDGSPFDFQHWAPGQPDNLGGNQHCLRTNYGGKSQHIIQIYLKRRM
ncbi:hypothetical protein LDENG_00244150 [Lucifuga dentata]|nr:hypothetical protein LDENG_00244150 [Lucifuga dentata]